MTIPSNRADCPTLNLRRTDQHTPPFSPTVGLLVWQSGSIRPVSNLRQAGFAMQIKRTKISNQSIFICDNNARKDRTNSILACVAFFGISHVHASCMTGWKPALNIGIGISRFNRANIGTSDISIRPQIGHSLNRMLLESHPLL